MSFYNIKLSSDPKIIGVKNGIYQIELIEKMYESKTLSQLKNIFLNPNLGFHQLPSLDFEFYFKLLKSAKETDFLSFSPHLYNCHFLLKENVQEIFRNLNIQPFSFINSKIINEKKQSTNNNFKMFYTGFQSWEIVNFEDTIFISGGFGKMPIIEHVFSNHEELKSFNGILRLKVLTLTNKFDSSLDLFYSHLGGLFVSDRFKSAIENSNITGVLFNNEINVVINL